ncbi:MAG: phosphatidylserine decarboxylase [Gammaproteobacteria bacterium]|nr:phosphatidylserine decarboxylase [Gammaproteobacteria bacterium]
MSAHKTTCHASLLDYLKALPQYLLPHHALSRLLSLLTHARWSPLKNFLIRGFSRLYHINLQEAQSERVEDYVHFNSFFTRALKPGVRPLAEGDRIIASPVDGTVSQCGPIESGRVFQAKGRAYTVQELLGGDEALAARFGDGEFATIYLSPTDYHRIHMPVDGTLTRMIHVPGRLFSVSPATTRVIPRLFARNERVVCVFETEAGPMAMVLVGAIFVASIETTWAGVVTPPAGRKVHERDYGSDEAPIRLRKGEEMGRFNMGSTVILLFPEKRCRWQEKMKPSTITRLGEAIGELVEH